VLLLFIWGCIYLFFSRPAKDQMIFFYYVLICKTIEFNRVSFLCVYVCVCVCAF